MKHKPITFDDFQRMPVAAPYQCRFARDSTALLNLWHLSRTALAKAGPLPTFSDRASWTAGAYNREHPETSTTGAYKDLCGLLGR